MEMQLFVILSESSKEWRVAPTVALGFLVQIAHCTLQSITWLQYWNGRFSYAYMLLKIT